MLEHKHLAVDACELKFNDDDWRVEGYATVYDSVDKVGDRIMPGAFDDWLEKGEAPAMRFEHLRWITPGKWDSVKSDDRGLRVAGHLTRDHSVAKDLRASMRHGTIRGLSQGFHVLEAKENDEGGRDIHKIHLVEVSFTATPAEPKATIESFKSELDSLQTLSDVEKLLRDSGNFSKSMATALFGRIKDIVRSESDHEIEMQKRRHEELDKVASLMDRYDLRNLLNKSN